MKKITLILIALLSSLFIYAQDLPNIGFENWSMNFLYEGLDSWQISNTSGYPNPGGVTLSEGTPYGEYAVRLESTLQDNDTILNFIYQGSIEDGPSGGIAYSDEFDQVRFQYKCNMVGSDSASIYIVKYYGVTPAQIIKKIGGEQTDWTEFSIDVPGGTCDSVFIGFISSDIMLEENVSFDSWIEIDSVYFHNSLGDTPSLLPNHNMENWSDISYQDIDDWYSMNEFLFSLDTYGVAPSTDAYSGTYSLMLKANNIYGDVIPGYLSIGEITMNDEEPILPVPYTYSPTHLVGYYKYFPELDDNAVIHIQMLQGGNPIGGCLYELEASSEWEYFEAPISYGGVPDQLTLVIMTGELPGSELYLDDINFDFQTSIIDKKANDLNIYPNPSNGIFNLSGQTIEKIEVLDLTGKCLFSKVIMQDHYSLSIKDFPSGVYLLKVQTPAGNIVKRIL